MMQEDALRWVAALFEEQAEKLTPDTYRDAIPAWDSLGVLTLLANLDSDFGIVLTDDEIQQIKTVRDILDVMQRKGTFNKP